MKRRYVKAAIRKLESSKPTEWKHRDTMALRFGFKKLVAALRASSEALQTEYEHH